MKSLPEIQAAICRLSPEEIRQLLEWMDNQWEDGLEPTDAFQNCIKASESDLATGKHSRTR